MMNENIPIVTNSGQIEKYAGQKVKVFGTYSELNVSQKTTREVFVGRVKIMLSDNSYILLETDDAGIRQKSEIEKYRNKSVAVTGTLCPHAYAWGDGTVASIIGPCLTDILSIAGVGDL